MKVRLPIICLLSSVGLIACRTPGGNLGGLSAGHEDGTDGDTETGDTDDADTGDTDDGPDTKFDNMPILDVGPQDECRPPANDDYTPGACTDKAPPDAWNEEVQWEWWGDDDVYSSSIMTPLVMNLTDDNQDGEIDLCDKPDVIVTVYDSVALYDEFFNSGEGLEWWQRPYVPGELIIFDGETGDIHFRIDGINGQSQPAAGDIDGDGLPEIVIAAGPGGPLRAFNHDGTPVPGFDGSNEGTGNPGQFVGAPAIADLDHDGSPEIVLREMVFSNTGELLAQLPEHMISGCAGDSATVVADVDEDGAPEIILGRSAFTWNPDGNVVEHYRLPDNMYSGYPHVADLDGDQDAEILVTTGAGMYVVDHEGNVVVDRTKPFMINENIFGVLWCRPGAVHDFYDGNGATPEFAFSAADLYAINWMTGEPGDQTMEFVTGWPVLDASGAATGTAFDFLGDGSPEAIYADENFLYVFDTADPEAEPLVHVPRQSATWTEYPVVADIDDDGSAEIVVVSNPKLLEYDPEYVIEQTTPVVQVIRDANDEWIQARRVWNQHTYHVTNVREDGTIPDEEPFHWKHLNTFRTNAQIESGGVCIPEG